MVGNVVFSLVREVSFQAMEEQSMSPEYQKQLLACLEA